MAELMIGCVALALAAILVAVAVMVGRIGVAAIHHSRQSQGECLEKLLAERRFMTDKSPESRMVLAQMDTTQKVISMLERALDQVMSFTAEGRDWKERDLERTRLISELAEAKERMAKLSDSHVRSIAENPPVAPGVQDNGDVRTVDLWKPVTVD